MIHHGERHRKTKYFSGRNQKIIWQQQADCYQDHNSIAKRPNETDLWIREQFYHRVGRIWYNTICCSFQHKKRERETQRSCQELLPESAQNVCMLNALNGTCPRQCKYSHRYFTDPEADHVLDKIEPGLVVLEKQLN